MADFAVPRGPFRYDYLPHVPCNNNNNNNNLASSLKAYAQTPASTDVDLVSSLQFLQATPYDSPPWSSYMESSLYPGADQTFEPSADQIYRESTYVANQLASRGINSTQ